MEKNASHRFLLRIVIPSLLAIGLFITSLYVIIIPSFESNMMDKKKDMINELTNTAWSLINEYNEDYKNEVISLEEAQKNAAERIEKLRYGKNKKDYFWITDQTPIMIMHPYRNELNGRNLEEYQDPNGKKIFMEAIRVVKDKGEGFINYQWQWKDDSTHIVPKLSFVKSFEEWGWIIGTGIYLEDVKEEITNLKRKLLRVSFFIIMIIIISISFVIKQSMRIEKLRSNAEEKLILSKLKYKSLVEASTEGTIMIIDDQILFMNQKMKKILGINDDEIKTLSFDDIFSIPWNKVLEKFDIPDKSVSFETKIDLTNSKNNEVIVSVSQIKYNLKDGYIIIIKELTRNKQIKIESSRLSEELQTSLLLMNQPIKQYGKDFVKCGLNETIFEASKLMARKGKDAILIEAENKIIGIVNNDDINKRAVAKEIDPMSSISSIMTSPIYSLNQDALLYELTLLCKSKSLSHVPITNSQGKIFSVINIKDIYSLHLNYLSFTIKEIEQSENISKLKTIYNRLPVIINALLESGDNSQIITRIVSTITDATTLRLIDFAIEKLGDPPCKYSFMVMGSEGRMEQTLNTDQDNAIVFEDQPNEESFTSTQTYFLEFGEYICNNLAFIGLKFCDGGIMSKNPKWVQPLSKWKYHFYSWITSGNPQDILDSSIFFDFRGINNDDSLAGILRKYINSISDNKAVFLYHMAQPIINFKVPVSTFGNIIGEQDNKELRIVNIKKVMLPVTSFVRIYALYNEIEETNTLKRAKELYNKELISKAIYNNLTLSYNYLMMFRLKAQVKRLSENEPPNNNLEIDELTEIEKTILKKIFSELSHIQTQVSFDFKGGV